MRVLLPSVGEVVTESIIVIQVNVRGNPVEPMRNKGCQSGRNKTKGDGKGNPPQHKEKGKRRKIREKP